MYRRFIGTLSNENLVSENGEEKEHYYTDKGFSEESVEIWLSSIEKGGERFHGSRLRDQRGVGCFLWQAAHGHSVFLILRPTLLR